MRGRGSERNNYLMMILTNVLRGDYTNFAVASGKRDGEADNNYNLGFVSFSDFFPPFLFD
jgi:hypothetical protein